MKKYDHHLFLSWLILASVITFCIIVAWDQGLFIALFSLDKSKISYAIMLIYALGMLHCGWRAWQISKQLQLSDKAVQLIYHHRNNPVYLDGNHLRLGQHLSLPGSVMTEFLVDTIQASMANDKTRDENRSTALAEIYTDRLKSSHEYGWFFVDAMIKMGLLGTIVGFIFMLGSVADSSNLDINAMQKVMQQMSAGMGTALYTTLAGLTGSLLLAMQYQLLDRGVDDLMHTAIHTAEVHILPNVITTTD